MKSTIKKYLDYIFFLVVLLSFFSFSGEQKATEAPVASVKAVSTFPDIPVKPVDLLEQNPDNRLTLFEAELYSYKLIMNVPIAYETKSWDAYCSVANILKTFDANSINDSQFELLKSAVKARKELIQIASLKDCMWYIWDKDMPLKEDASTLIFTTKGQDNLDFKPFLVPYLLKDQKEAKGNMIVIAGGGYSSRGNAMEGYPVAKAFNELGYNSFVLQRRVEPYCAEDIWMDIQRSVRYIRYNAKSMGLGGTDCIAASGFSGGGATIMGEITYLYGDIQPTIYDKTYKADAVDAVSADLDVACVIYGPNASPRHDGTFKGLISDNPKIPAMFLAAGADDKTGAPQDNYTLNGTIYGKTMVEMHTFANVGHGFGIGIKGTNSIFWPAMADGFISQAMSKANETKESIVVEIPKEYTKYQSYKVTLGFGPADVTCAVNDAGTKFYAYFAAFDSIQIVGGTVKDGVVTVTYDKSGFMTGDAQAIYSAADKNAWQNIK